VKIVLFGATGMVGGGTGWYRVFYSAFGVLYPVLRRALPSLVTSTDVLGRALVRVGLDGFPKPILETRDINRIG
jgi:hypothetical protein